MLREIINFTRSLSPESFKRGLQPTSGLHLAITLNENSEPQAFQAEVFINPDKPSYGIKWTKETDEKKFEWHESKDPKTPFLQDCLSKQTHTKMVSINKALDSKKKIHSCSPFCVAFKLKTIGEAQDRLNDYFNTAVEYCESDGHRRWAEIFKNYCHQYLVDLLQRVIREFQAEQSSDRKSKISENDYLYVYLANLAAQDYECVHQNYLCRKAFNKEEFNVSVNELTFGVSDFLTGFNQKKPFLQHQTAMVEVNERIASEEAVWLFKFSQLKENKQLPNPLPIFIDKDELNEEVVKMFHRDENRKIGYAEMIRAVYEKEKDLGNYYLLNMQGKEEVKDFDFVSSFQFEIEPPIFIENLYAVESELTSQKIDDIFELEKGLARRIFDGQLIRKKDDGWWLRYFDEIEYKPQYIRPAMYKLVLKYRKAFYDYIYKSKREAITSNMFHDIMQTGILDDLRQDEHRSNEFKIKEKLNIWFSLFEYFDQKRNQDGDKIMANQIRQLQGCMQKIVSDDEAHLETDQEFAYASGQVIYYLLSRSEASNKSHALLEPFLQKTDAEQFKLAISRVFAQYKHDISFYKGRFEKLMSEVLGYDPETNLKSLLPMILAGYFAESVIYQKSESTQAKAS